MTERKFFGRGIILLCFPKDNSQILSTSKKIQINSSALLVDKVLDKSTFLFVLKSEDLLDIFQFAEDSSIILSPYVSQHPNSLRVGGNSFHRRDNFFNPLIRQIYSLRFSNKV